MTTLCVTRPLGIYSLIEKLGYMSVVIMNAYNSIPVPYRMTPTI